MNAKVFFCGILVAGLLVVGHADELTSFRERAKKVKPLSSEDYALGKELIQELRRLGASRKMVLPHTYMVMETVMYRSGKLWYGDKIWRDRALFNSRDLWEPGMLSPKSITRSFELMRQSGVDVASWFGTASFNSTGAPFFEALKRLNVKDFYLSPVVHGSIRDMLNKEMLSRTNTDPAIWRIGGKGVLLTYDLDRLSAEDVKKYRQSLAASAGADNFYMVSVISGHRMMPPHRYPNRYFRQHRGLAATTLLHYYDYLTGYLKVCDGIATSRFFELPDSRLDKDYLDLVYTLCSAVAAQPEFNGKKLFGGVMMVGYTNNNGSQSLSCDGTATLRNTFEMALQHRPDYILGFEWDELNENTNSEPTVTKPMSAMRIMRYYTSKFRNQPVKPLPGDNLELPNLIVSQRRQLAGGEDFKLELLNVPDGSPAKTYSVAAELSDENGKLLYQSEPVKFESEKISAHDIHLSGDARKLARAVRVRLLIKSDKDIRIDGLPYTVLRPLEATDRNWFCTPVRNVLTPEEAAAEFKIAGDKVGFQSSISAGEPLMSLETVQNSVDGISCDPNNEYLLNDSSRQLFRLSLRYLNFPPNMQVKYTFKVDGAKSALELRPRYDASRTAAKVPADGTKEFKAEAGIWNVDNYLSIKLDELTAAELVINGTRMSGKNKDSVFSWKFPIAEIAKRKVVSHVFDDGLAVSLETFDRTPVLPLPLNADKAKFSGALTPVAADSVFGVRAVTKSGKVWWSAPWALPAEDAASIQLRSFDNQKGWSSHTAVKSLVPEVNYIFDPANGYILPSSAGRETYAHAGSMLSTSTGFDDNVCGRLSYPYVLLSHWKKNSGGKPAPVWEKQSDGSHALRFDGVNGNFAAFPNTVIPQSGGFHLEMEITPEDVERNQIIWGQQGNYLSGFQLSIRNKKLFAELVCRQPQDLKTANITRRFATNLELRNKIRQKIGLSYDGEKITISCGGRSETFPFAARTLWLTRSSFGGDGKQCFRGLLHSFNVKYSK